MATIGKNLLLLTSSNIISSLINFVYFPILAKGYNFSAEVFGSYQFYFSFGSIFVFFCLLSLDYSYIGEQKKHSREEAINFFNTSFFISTFLLLVSLLFLWMLEIINLFDLLNIFLFTNSESFFLICISLFKDKKFFKQVAKYTIVRNSIKVMIGISLGFFLESAFIFIIALSISAYVVGIICILRFFEKEFTLNINIDYIKNFFNNNKSTIIFQTMILGLGSFATNFPVFAIRNVFGDQKVGLYSISIKLLGAATSILAGAMSKAFLPYFSKSTKDEKTIFKRQSLISAIFFPFFTVFSLFSKYVITFLFGNEFIDAIPIFSLMIPQYFMMSVVIPYTSTFIAHKRTHKLLVTYLVNFLVMILITFLASMLNFSLNSLILSFVILSVLVRLFTLILSFKTAGVKWADEFKINLLFVFCLFGLSISSIWKFVFLLGIIFSCSILLKNRVILKNLIDTVLSLLKIDRKKDAGK